MNCLKITCKHLKVVQIAGNIIFFVFKKLPYIRMISWIYKDGKFKFIKTKILRGNI